MNQQAGAARASSGSASPTDVGKRASEVIRKFRHSTFIPERVNTELSRRYDLGNEVGSGGYGKVFKGVDRNVQGRVVAIKRVRITDEATKSALGVTGRSSRGWTGMS